MASLLNLIWCWLVGFWDTLSTYHLNLLDAFLSVADVAIAALPTLSVTPPNFAAVAQYTWILGATGVDVCLGIVATALVIRFTLASIPFVRWGS